jgi:hypothetical protein
MTEVGDQSHECDAAQNPDRDGAGEHASGWLGAGIFKSKISFIITAVSGNRLNWINLFGEEAIPDLTQEVIDF